jgi:hypothetical protein
MTAREERKELTGELYTDAVPPDAHPRVSELYRYWRDIHPPGGSLPGRQHLDPTAIPTLLPFVWLADVQRVPLRFRYRLLGTEHRHVFGRDYTGWWLDDVHAGFYTAPAYHQYVDAVEQGRVGYRRGHTLVMLPEDYRSIERLMLPLARDGKTVDMLLSISLYQRR